MLRALTIASYVAFSLVLLPYGYNTLVLLIGATRYRNPEPTHLNEYPSVTNQLPVYNEANVIERLIDSICELDWSKDRLEIQVLDDSNDETVDLVDSKVRFYQSRGYQIEAIRRDIREGYKAGALQYGLETATSEYIHPV